MDRPLSEWFTEFGRRVAAQRLAQNRSQAELAQAAGISARTLVRMEAGEPPQLENALRVLAALGFEPELDQLLPEPAASPIAELRAQGRPRRRRASGRRKHDESPVKDWQWGDEE